MKGHSREITGLVGATASSLRPRRRFSALIAVAGAALIVAAACGGAAAPAPAAGSATAAPSTGGAAPTQAVSKPATGGAAAIPAGWQVVKHPTANCQVAVPGDWTVVPEAGGAGAEGAALTVGPISDSDFKALAAMPMTPGSGVTVMVNTPTRVVMKQVYGPGTTSGQVAYQAFWSSGSAYCVAMLALGGDGVQKYEAAARQIAELAGAGR